MTQNKRKKRELNQKHALSGHASDSAICEANRRGRARRSIGSGARMPRPAGGVSQAAAAGGPAWARPDHELTLLSVDSFLQLLLQYCPDLPVLSSC